MSINQSISGERKIYVKRFFAERCYVDNTLLITPPQDSGFSGFVYALKKKYREIGADEGVTGSCAAKSVTGAIMKLQKYFIKNGWMPKEA